MSDFYLPKCKLFFASGENYLRETQRKVGHEKFHPACQTRVRQTSVFYWASLFFRRPLTKTKTALCPKSKQTRSQISECVRNRVAHFSFPGDAIKVLHYIRELTQRDRNLTHLANVGLELDPPGTGAEGRI
jgi:hypothetical protein